MSTVNQQAELVGIITPPGWNEDHRPRLTRDELLATQEKIEKINARAVKRGWTGRLEVRWEEETVTQKNAVTGLEQTWAQFAVEITGSAPKYNGWEFLAILDWHSADQLITRTAPGVTLEGAIDRGALREGACDQCRTTRDRLDVYLVRNTETGELRQVGSTCIKDFLGWDARPVFISTAEVTDELGESYGGGGGPRDYDTLTVLAASWAVIQVTGYKPASFDDATKGSVSFVLDPPSNLTDNDRKFLAAIRPLIDKAYPQAKLIRDYILSDSFTGDSEYVVNLKASVGSQFVTARAFGLVVSAPQTWAKSIERDLTRRAEKAELLNEWIGEVKQRLTLKVQVKAIRFIDGDWGTSYLYTMVDEAGHTLKWFSSNHALGEETTDEWFTIKATIKAHDLYQDTKQTVLTRGKVQ